MSEIVEKSFCNSILISIYTVIEKSFSEICDVLKSEKSIPLKYSDLNGQGVTRAKLYLEKLAGIIFDTKESNFLSGINAIRNIIAHENGEMYNISKANLGRIQNIVDQSVGISIKEIEDFDDKNNKIKKPSEIEIHLEFIEYCLEHGRAVFESLLSKVRTIHQHSAS
jgi:hypothetical protein